MFLPYGKVLFPWFRYFELSVIDWFNEKASHAFKLRLRIRSLSTECSSGDKGAAPGRCLIGCCCPSHWRCCILIGWAACASAGGRGLSGASCWGHQEAVQTRQEVRNVELRTSFIMQLMSDLSASECEWGKYQLQKKEKTTLKACLYKERLL